MKKSLLVKSLLIAALPLATQTMGAESLLPGTVSNVSFNLTVSQIVEGTVAKDENGKALKSGDEGAGPTFVNIYNENRRGVAVAQVEEFESKTVIKKYTIRDFLNDMVTAEVIDNVRGWSLVRACGTRLVPVQGEVPPADVPVVLGNEVVGQEMGYYLLKKNEEPVNVTNFFVFMAIPLLKDTTSMKKVTPLTEGDPSAPFSFSYAAKFKRIGILAISATETPFLSGLLGGILGGGFISPPEPAYEDIDVDAYIGVGVATGSEKVGTFGNTNTPIFLPGATKVDVSLGANIDIFVSAEEQESGEGDELETILEGISLIEGSVSLSAGKPMEDMTYFLGNPT